MNPLRVLSRVDPWLSRCCAWGRAKPEHYANGGAPRSLAVSGDRGAEKNWLMQAQGKLGECAVALLAGLDPETAVDWRFCDGDGGRDIMLPGGTLVDVKTNFDQPSMYPSKDINHLIARRRFFAFVSVSIDDRADLAGCWVEGWIAKEEFLASKKISAGRLDWGEPKQPGTWYVFKADLRSIRDLFEMDRKGGDVREPDKRPISQAERMLRAWIAACDEPRRLGDIGNGIVAGLRDEERS
jgi:hypothetical protein